MTKNIHSYPGADIEVTWDKRLCIHVGECGRAEGDLFEAGRDPWCAPDTSNAEAAAEVCRRCPTGALAYTRGDGGAIDGVEGDNKVIVANHGPLYFSGELEIEGAAEDMPAVKYRAALCRCGQSQNKPFCDNAHEKAGFQDRGAVGRHGTPGEGGSGPLKIKALPKGPLLVTGSLRIHASSGRMAWEGKKVALCRCGASADKPFCDGAHVKAGFDAD